MAPSGPGLELRRVVKRYPDASVGPIDLTVGRGEVVSLVGESGSGKSTLLRLLLGLVRADAGEVRIAGAPVQVGAAPARPIGYVVQRGALFPHLTAAENVTLVARHHRWDPARIAHRLGELMALVRLPETVLARFPHQISSGQAQRVALVRALFLDPEVLLLDEPLGALDPLTRASLQDDLRQLFADLGKTVVLVTHDLGEAALLANRLVLLRDGVVAQEGSIDDLARHPADDFVTRFVRAHRGLQLPPEGEA